MSALKERRHFEQWCREWSTTRSRGRPVTGSARWWRVRQAVLDHQSNGGVDDPACVMAPGVGQVGHVGVEGAAALRAVVLGVEHDEVAGPAGEGVAEVVEDEAGCMVA